VHRQAETKRSLGARKGLRGRHEGGESYFLVKVIRDWSSPQATYAMYSVLRMVRFLLLCPKMCSTEAPFTLYSSLHC